MLAKTAVPLMALLGLSAAACSGGSTSSATTASNGSSIVRPTSSITDPPSTSTIMPPSSGGVGIAASTVVETEATAKPTTPTSVVPTAPTSSAAAPSSSVDQPSPPSTAGGPAAGGNVVDSDCTGARADGPFDLLHVTVERLNSAYRLIARYSGDTVQHDILVSFDLGASAYQVTAELFEDGNGVAQISDSQTLGGVFLDPPQSILRNLVDLTVRDDQIPRLSGAPFTVTVSLRADGSGIESCP